MTERGGVARASQGSVTDQRHKKDPVKEEADSVVGLKHNTYDTTHARGRIGQIEDLDLANPKL